MKYCETCGKELVRREDEFPNVFARRRFCDRVCRNAARGRKGGRYAARCRGCGGVLSNVQRGDPRRPVGYCSFQCRNNVAAYVIEELDFLIGTDTPDSLARRLGYNSVDSLERLLVRHGRADLAAYFSPFGSNRNELAGATA